MLHQVDFGQAGVDHFAVQLTATFRLQISATRHQHCPRIDVAKMRDPAAVATARDICQTVPLVPWEVDPHSHYALVTDHLVQNLSRALPVHRAHNDAPFSPRPLDGSRESGFASVSITTCS